MQRDFEWHGHRGCRGLKPENSIPAFLHAIDLGVDSIEMDVVISKDRKVVVAHEGWMPADICEMPDGRAIEEKNEKSFNLYRMKYNEIRYFNCGLPHPRFPDQQSQRVHRPLLSEVFKVVESYTKHRGLKPIDYTIELKCSPEEERVFHPKVSKFVRRVVKVIKKYGVEERTLLQAFDQRVLKRLNERHPAVHCSYLRDEVPDLDKELKELGFIPSVLGLRFDLVTKEIVQECEKHGMKVIPWTVNEVSDMKEVLDKGVHGIITDFPDRLPALLEAIQKVDVSTSH